MFDRDELISNLRARIDQLENYCHNNAEDTTQTIARLQQELLGKEYAIEELKKTNVRDSVFETFRSNNNITKETIIGEPIDKRTINRLEREIFDLRSALQERDTEIDRLHNMKQIGRVEYIKEAPEVVRIRDPPIKEIQYEQDPFLLEQLARLKKELEIALQHEQTAKLDLRDKIQENARLRREIEELKALPPKTVTIDKIIPVVKEIPGKIGRPLEILMDRFASYQNERLKGTIFFMLYYHHLFRKYYKLSMQRKEKVIVNQKLEVVDGTFDVWTSLRGEIVDWLFNIFVVSADKAHIRKMYLFSII